MFWIRRREPVYANRSITAIIREIAAVADLVLRLFAGRMRPLGDWGAKLAAKFAAEFGPQS